MRRIALIDIVYRPIGETYTSIIDCGYEFSVERVDANTGICDCRANRESFQCKLEIINTLTKECED